MSDDRFPAGCLLIKKTLWHNSAVSSATCDSTADMTCVCGGGRRAYTQETSTCQAKDRLTGCNCKEIATTLALEFTEEEYHNDPNYPAGCFILKKKLWYNRNTSSVASCSSDNKCICAGEPIP